MTLVWPLAVATVAAVPALAAWCEAHPQAGDGHKLFFVSDLEDEEGHLMGIELTSLHDLRNDEEVTVGVVWVRAGDGRDPDHYDVVPASLSADRHTPRVRTAVATLRHGRVVAALPAGPSTPAATLTFDLSLGGLSDGRLVPSAGQPRTFTAERGVRPALPVRQR